MKFLRHNWFLFSGLVCAAISFGLAWASTVDASEYDNERITVYCPPPVVVVCEKKASGNIRCGNFSDTELSGLGLVDIPEQN